MTLTALGHSPFTSGDVGRLIRLEYPGREPAWGVITAYSSGTSVSAYMYRRPPVAEYTESWRFGAWCDAVGWPSVGTFFQQRLFAASSQTYPQKVWGSQTDDFENMAPDSFVEGALTAEDNDALDFTLAGEEASKIYWMAGQREFLLGTGAGIYRISSRGAVLTPQDFNAELQVVMKLADVQPIKINDTAVFVTKSKRRLYDVGYKYEVDGYQAAELSVFSDHLATTAIEEIVYQSDPVPLIWARLNGGRLVCYTYNRQQQVIGGTPRVMAGTSSVNSIGVIPGQTSAGQVYRSDDRDEVWLLVEREINGSTLYCVEVMEGMYQGPARGIFQSHSTYETNQKSDQVDAFYVESGLTYIGSPAATVTGLGHLNGETVKIVVNGAPHTDKVVSGGSVALDFTPSGASMTVHVGLGYDWAIRTLKLPYGARAGSGVVAPKQTYQLGLILLDSSNFEYAVEYDREMGAWREHVFRRTDMELGEAVPLFTGEVGPFTLECGTSTDPRIHLKGDAPLPFTLLGFVPSVDTHEQK